MVVTNPWGVRFLKCGTAGEGLSVTSPCTLISLPVIPEKAVASQFLVRGIISFLQVDRQKPYDLNLMNLLTNIVGEIRLYNSEQ